MQAFHLIGCGGVAMGGLAIALKQLGYLVSGSDAGVYPPMSEMLAEAGIDWTEGFDGDLLHKIHASHGDLRVIVGNAIPRGNPELEAALTLGLRLSSMPEVIGEIFLQAAHSVVIAGTHGKTTTSNLCAWLLEKCGAGPGWLIGGRPFDLPTGLKAAHPPAGGEAIFVSEGDEYDTCFWDKRSKFFHYWPHTLVINHVEFDHADIFQSLEQITAVFARLAMLVPADGLILANGDAPAARKALEQSWAPVVFFGEGQDAAYRLLKEEASEAGSRFHVRVPLEGAISRDTLDALAPAQEGAGSCWTPDLQEDIIIESPLSGEYNGRNLLVALAVMDRLGQPRRRVLELMKQFKGPSRRMDLYHNAQGLVLCDDFAHHPTAIRSALAALKMRFPDRKLIAFVEPRSNTSVRNVMQAEWIDALKGANGVLFGALHRAWKYHPDELFSFDDARRELEASGVAFHQADTADELLAQLDPESFRDTVGWQKLLSSSPQQTLLAVFSNGAFDGLLGKLKVRYTLEAD